MENWIGLWLKHFNRNPKAAFRDLVYVGYNGTMIEAIKPIKFRPRDIFNVSQQRKTFNCLVVGAAGSGKSSFLDTFIGASVEESKDGKVASKRESAKLIVRSVIKSIKEKDPKQNEKYNNKYLILQEVSDE